MRATSGEIPLPPPLTRLESAAGHLSGAAEGVSVAREHIAGMPDFVKDGRAAEGK